MADFNFLFFSFQGHNFSNTTRVRPPLPQIKNDRNRGSNKANDQKRNRADGTWALYREEFIYSNKTSVLFLSWSRL